MYKERLKDVGVDEKSMCSSPPSAEVGDLAGGETSDVSAKLCMKKNKSRFVKSHGDHTSLKNSFLPYYYFLFRLNVLRSTFYAVCVRSFGF